MQSDRLKSRVVGSFYGCAIGDSLGMPVEMMSAEEILAMGGVSDFIAPVQKKIKGTRGLKAGDVTDDWALTNVVARSLIRCGEFDIHDIGLGHVEAYEKYTFGWGKSTADGMWYLLQYYNSRGEHGRRPGTWESKGEGNGVAMKVMPLAYWNAVKVETARWWGTSMEPFGYWDQVKAMGKLTHGPMGWIGAYAIGAVIMDIVMFDLRGSIYEKEWILERLIRRVRFMEAEVGVELSTKLEKLPDLSEIGVSGKVIDSVVRAIGIFIKNDDFREGMYEAVNGGGDTDSIASMVGGMMGAFGEEKIPEEWRERFGFAGELGEEFYNALTVDSRI